MIICGYTDYNLINASISNLEKKSKGRIVYFNWYFMFSGFEFKEYDILLEWTLVEQSTRITQLKLWSWERSYIGIFYESWNTQLNK